MDFSLNSGESGLLLRSQSLGLVAKESEVRRQSPWRVPLADGNRTQIAFISLLDFSNFQRGLEAKERYYFGSVSNIHVQIWRELLIYIVALINFLSNHQTVFHSSWMFYIPTSNVQVFLFFHIFTNICDFVCMCVFFFF